MVLPPPAAAASASVFVYGTLMSPRVLSALIGRCPDMEGPAVLPDHSRHPVRGCVFPGVVLSGVEAEADKATATAAGGSSRIPFPSAGGTDRSSPPGSGGGTAPDGEPGGVGGVLLSGVRPGELAAFDWFEDEGTVYTRADVRVLVAVGTGVGDGPDRGDSAPPPEPAGEDGSGSGMGDRWREVRAQAYLWASPIQELELGRGWDFESFERDHLDWYLRSTVRPSREELDRLGIGRASSS